MFLLDENTDLFVVAQLGAITGAVTEAIEIGRSEDLLDGIVRVKRPGQPPPSGITRLPMWGTAALDGGRFVIEAAACTRRHRSVGPLHEPLTQNGHLV